MENNKKIHTELLDLFKKSSSPFSNFKVASIVIDKDGNKYEGVNVESAAYGATICAERNAIQTAITQGMKRGDLREVHISAMNQKSEILAVSACGICRQVIAEQSAYKANVFLYDEKGLVSTDTIETLLPNAFLGQDF